MWLVNLLLKTYYVYCRPELMKKSMINWVVYNGNSRDPKNRDSPTRHVT